MQHTEVHINSTKWMCQLPPKYQSMLYVHLLYNNTHLHVQYLSHLTLALTYTHPQTRQGVEFYLSLIHVVQGSYKLLLTTQLESGDWRKRTTTWRPNSWPRLQRRLSATQATIVAKILHLQSPYIHSQAGRNTATT